MTAAAALDVKRVLVADDELNMRRVLEAMLRREGYEVITAANGLEAIGGMATKGGVQTVITDLKMPGLDGMGLLKRLTAEYPDVPVVMITAHGSVESAVEAVKLGAFDYLEKPFEQEQIRQVVAKALNTYALARRDARPEEPSGQHGRFRLVGQSPAIRTIYGVVEKVANTPSTVLISGESGTGKELIARALHENSSRHAGPFIKINCAAIPKTLMESELFGYDKGAFTGAVGAKPGRFELAHGGTLFLDEIGEIPIEMQVKLLRVLQESEFERVGGIKTIKVDVRLVTATNRDLLAEVGAGAFREDLFYRLNVVPIHISASAGAARGYPFAGGPFHCEVQRSLEERDRRHHPRGRRAAGRLSVARQHSRAREPDGADGAVLRGARRSASRSAALRWRVRPHLNRCRPGPTPPARSRRAPPPNRSRRRSGPRPSGSNESSSSGPSTPQAATSPRLPASSRSRKSLQTKMKELGLREK